MGAGMDMVQDNALSQDIKTIMSEQLYEMKMLREEMKSSSEKRDGTSMAMNPFASNAYYTEYHDKVINEAYGLADSKKGLINTLADYANQTGYADVMLSKEGFVGGRGISARDELLAKDAFSTSIQRGVIEKTEGGLGFGADMAGGAAAGKVASMLGAGAIPGIGLAIAGGMVATHYTGKFIEEQKAYLNFRDDLMSSSDRFITLDESNDPTGGFTKKEARTAARKMVNIADDMDISNEEMSSIFSGALQNNLLTGASDVETFEKNMSSLVDNVKRTAKSLGKTYEEAVNMIGELGRSGVGLDTAGLVLGMSDGISAGLGMTNEQYVSFTSARTDSQTMGTGLSSDGITIGNTVLDHRLAAEVAAAKASDDKGYYENYLINNEERISGIVSGSANQGTVGMLNRQIAMAASVEGPGGGISVDKDRFQDIASKLASGDLSINDVGVMAIDTSSKWKDPDVGLMRFEASYTEFGKYNPLEHGKQGSAASIRAIMRESLGDDGFKEFLSMDESARVSTMSGILEANGVAGESANYYNYQMDESLSDSFWEERNLVGAATIRDVIANEYSTTKNKYTRMKSLPMFMKDWDASEIDFRFSDYKNGELAPGNYSGDIYESLTAMSVAILGGDEGNKIQNILKSSTGFSAGSFGLDFRETTTEEERIKRFVEEMSKEDNHEKIIAHAGLYGDAGWMKDALKSGDGNKQEDALLKLIDMGLDGAKAQATYSESREEGVTVYEKEVKNLEQSLKDSNELLGNLLRIFTDGTTENMKILRNLSARGI